MARRNSENNDKRTEQFRKIFIGGLTPHTDEPMLRDYYSQWGEIVDAVVMKDNVSRRSRGFGFVTYREPEMVDVAQANRPHEIDGKIVEAKRAMPREVSHLPESHMTVKKLYVSALKKDVRAEHLRDYFSKFGNVIDAEVVMSKDTGESRCFGFVTFDDYDPVDKCILYGPHHMCNCRAEVRKALSKEQINETKRKRQDRYEDSNGYGVPVGYGYDHGGYGGYGPPMGGYGSGGYGSPGGGYGGMGYGGGWGGGHSNGGWSQGGMGDNFGHYGGQHGYAGGPMRSGPPAGGYARSSPYGGGFGRRY